MFNQSPLWSGLSYNLQVLWSGLKSGWVVDGPAKGLAAPNTFGLHIACTCFLKKTRASDFYCSCLVRWLEYQPVSSSKASRKAQRSRTPLALNIWAFLGIREALSGPASIVHTALPTYRTNH